MKKQLQFICIAFFVCNVLQAQTNNDTTAIKQLLEKETYCIAEESYFYIVNKHRLVKISDNEKSILKALPIIKNKYKSLKQITTVSLIMTSAGL